MRILKRSTVPMPCPLTSDEFSDRARDLARTLEDLQAEDSRQEMLKREMKSATAALEARRDMLALVVSRRAETREVEVEDRANDKAGTVERVRLDTGEVFHSRAMTDEERQLSMVPL